MANLIVWADIPVADMARAKAFYGALLGAEVADMPGAEGTVALLPMEGDGSGADLAAGEGQVPSAQGCTIYLDADGRMEEVLARVEPAGGTVLAPKAFMGEGIGYLAFFLDSEGNRIGLHSTT